MIGTELSAVAGVAGALLPEVRPAAAIGWFCLTDVPAPDDLSAAVDGLATDECNPRHGRPALDGRRRRSRRDGLRRCIRVMLHPEQSDPAECDDPWAPRR